MPNKKLVVYKPNVKGNPNTTYPYLKTIEVTDTEDLGDKMREIIGGYLENVHPYGLPDNYSMVVDEEGLIKQLDFNYVGTKLYWHNVPRRNLLASPIVGTIVILKDVIKDGELDWAALNDDEVRYITEHINKTVSIIK